MFDGKLNITGSIRQDYSEIVRRQPLNANVYLQDATGNVRAFTYSAGVTYNILGKKLVAYFSNGKSFNPTPTVDPNVGTIYGNLMGEGTDLGLKGLLFGERFSYTVSFYKIKQTNETTRNPFSQQNPDDTSIPYYMDGGSTEGRGAAIDVSGRLLPGLAIIGNMSWVSIETVENRGNPALVGTRPIGIPVRTGAVALRYSPQNFWRGLTLSAR
jgi:outer membrane receptor for ferric coprogen and ferric-rhodotorulic acid